MKQILFAAIGIFIALNAFSQKEYRSNKEYAKVAVEKTPEKLTKSNTPIQANTVDLKDGKASMVDRYEIGRSANVYSVLSSKQQCLSYDPISDVILGSFRSDPTLYPGTTAGALIGHHSVDEGMSWDPLVLINPDPSSLSPRNPSSAIYNPYSSGIPEDVYALSAGIAFSGIDWDSIYIGSAKLDSSNTYHNYFPTSEDEVIHSRMIVIQDHLHLFGTHYIQVVMQGAEQTMKHYDFSINNPGSAFHLASVNEYQPDWLVDPGDGHFYALYNTWSAWSLDGSIGYMWMVGVTNETYNYGVYQPQLAYTSDGGNTWNPLSINLEDHPTLVQFLPPWEDAAGNPGTVRPSFLTADRTYPGVVDYEGKLHLFSNVFGSSRGDVLDPDNSYWVVDEQYGGHIFDFIIDQNGLVDVVFVDSVRTDVSPDNAFGDVSWDHRLQAAKSQDELSVFCVWAEDIHSEQSELLTPDIKGWGYLASDQIILGDGSINFTGDDLFSGFYFFHYLGEIATWDPPNCFWLHISTSLSLEEFQVNDPLAPVTHTYLGGIGFCSSNIETHTSSRSELSLSQNIPNPATTHTSFTITAKGNSPVKLTVTNMTGQEVYTEDLGIVNGNKKVYLDLSDFKSGVYFYTLRSGNAIASKKMIVR